MCVDISWLLALVSCAVMSVLQLVMLHKHVIASSWKIGEQNVRWMEIDLLCDGTIEFRVADIIKG